MMTWYIILLVEYHTFSRIQSNVRYDSDSIKTASFTYRNYCRSYHFSSNRAGSGGVNGVSKSNGISSGLLGPLPNQPLPLSAIAAWHITQENSDNPAANDAEQVMKNQGHPFCKYSHAPNKGHVRYRPFAKKLQPYSLVPNRTPNCKKLHGPQSANIAL